MDEIFVLASVNDNGNQKYEIDKKFWPNISFYYLYELFLKDAFINNKITEIPNILDSDIIEQQYYDRKKIFYSIINILNYGVIPVFMRNKPDHIEELKAISNEIHIKISKFTLGIDFNILRYNNDYSHKHILSAVRSLPTSTEIYVIGYYFSVDVVRNLVKDYIKMFPPVPNLFTVNEDYYKKANKDFDKNFISVLYSEQLIQHIYWFIYESQTIIGKYDYLYEIKREEVVKKEPIIIYSEEFINPDNRLLSILKQLKRSTYRTVYMHNYYAILDENKILIDYFANDDELIIYESKNIFIRRAIAKNYNDIVKRTYAEYAYKILFGVESFMNLNIPNDTYDGLMRILSDNEQKDIVEYIDNIKKNELEKRENRCEHVELVFNLRLNIDQIVMKNIYEDIVKLIKPGGKNNKMHLCNVCGLELICPHELVKTEYELGLIVNYRDMLTKYSQFILNEDVTKKDNSHSFYCFICNSLLYQDDMAALEMDDEEILYVDNSEIWKSALFLWSQYVSFREGIFDKSKIIRNMINITTPIIDARLKLIIDKSALSKYFNIEANIVFVAYLLNLHDKTDGKINFNYKEYMKSVPISEKKNSQRIIDAYRKQLKNINIEKIDKELEYSNIYSLPLITTYAKLLRRDLNKLSIVMDTDKYDDSNNIENSANDVNSFIANKESEKFIYSQMKILNIGQFKSLDIMRTLYNIDELHLINNLVMLCFNKWLKFYQYFEENNKFKNKIDDKNDVRITPDIIQSKIIKIDSYFKVKRLINRIMPKLYIKPEVPKLTADKQNISCIYDRDGNKHKWDSFIFSDKSIALIKEIKFIEYYNKTQIIDLYSSSTKTAMSDILKTSDKDIQQIYDILLHETEVNSLYNFYAILCPKSNGHEYKSGKCEKCGYYVDMTKSDKNKFYTDNKDNFARQKNENVSSVNNTEMNRKNIISNTLRGEFIKMLKVKAEDINMENKYKSEFELRVTDQMIDLISMKYEIKRIFVKHIGAIGRLKYEDIEYDIEVPKYDKDDSDFIYVLLNHIKTLITNLQISNLRFDKLNLCVELSSYFIKTRNVFEVMQWLRYYLYDVLLELHDSNIDLAKRFFSKIIVDDGLFCRHKEIDDSTIDIGNEVSDVLIGIDALEKASLHGNDNGGGDDEE